MIKASPQNTLLAWLDGLSDPARLRLLRLLERQELGVAELCDVLQMPQSTVSRHLKLLSGQDWVASRRDGTNNLYRMSLDDLSPPARRLWTLAREQTAEWAAIEQDRLRLERVLAQREKDSKAFFASAAGQWDTLRDWLYGKGFLHALTLALIPSDWTIADLGCGTGALAAELAKYVKRVIGVDQSAEMLRTAKKQTADLQNIEFHKADLESLPIKNAAVDAAVISLVLTYLKEPALALTEAARIIRPGGRLVIVDLLRHDREDFRRHMGQHHAGFEPEHLSTLLQNAGFTNPLCHSLPPEPQAKGPALILATANRSKH